MSLEIYGPLHSKDEMPAETLTFPLVPMKKPSPVQPKGLLIRESTLSLENLTQCWRGNSLEKDTSRSSTKQNAFNKVVQVWTEILTCTFTGRKFPAEWLKISIDTESGYWSISGPLKSSWDGCHAYSSLKVVPWSMQCNWQLELL